MSDTVDRENAKKRRCDILARKKKRDSPQGENLLATEGVGG